MRREAALALLVFLAACGSKTPSPPTTPGGVESIRGTERLGWDQRAGDTVELATFRYAIYIDGNRSEAADVSCGNTAGASGFGCSSRLPSMTPGSHTLELATFIVDGSTILESSRSAPLRVNVTSSITGSTTGILAGRTATTQDGVALRVEMILDDVEEPTDMAFDPAGRLFVAERAGTVRIVDAGGRSSLSSVDDVATAQDGGLLSLALPPDFEDTHFVYVAHTVAGETGANTLRVARYREVGGKIGERMVLLDRVAMRPSSPASKVTFGPDGKLYVATDDGGDARQSADASSLNGKVLRLNADGTTPDDRPGAGAVYLQGYRSPRGLAWIGGRTLWTADGEPQNPERLIVVSIPAERARRAAVVATYALDAHTNPSDAIVYSSNLIPAFRGNLFVAAAGGYILRARIDPRAPAKIVATEKLLEGIGPISALAVGPEGAIYFATTGAVARLSVSP